MTTPWAGHGLTTCIQWNAVALWAWDIVVDNCAICRNHIMDLCTSCVPFPATCSTNWSSTLQASSAKQTRLPLPARSAQSLGASATYVFLHYSLVQTQDIVLIQVANSTLSISTASLDGSRPARCVL